MWLLFGQAISQKKEMGMTTKKEFVNRTQSKESVRSEVVRQQKQAYYLSKYLRAKTNKKVSYVISTSIKFENGFWIPVTEIRELPVIRIHHNKEDSEDEFLDHVDIDNAEG